jgi:type II secretory pathway component PulM
VLLVMITAGVGIVLLLVLLVLVLPPVRRFTRANATLRSGVAERVAVLRVLADERRRGPT